MQSIKKLFNRFSLDQKVQTLIVIEVIGFLIVAVVAVAQIRNVGNEVETIAEVTFPLFTSIENIHSEIQSQQINTRELIIYLFGGKNSIDQIRDKYLKGNNRIQNSIETAEQFIRKSVLQQYGNENALSLNGENLLLELFELRRTIQAFDELVSSKVLQDNNDLKFVGSELLVALKKNEVSIHNKLNKIHENIESIRSELVKHAVYVKRIAIGFIVLTLLAAVIFFIAMLLLIIRQNISKPLQLLTDTINAFTAMLKVEESEFEKGLMVRRDELGRMSRSFNRLKHDLWRQGQDLHSAKEDAEKANRAKSMFLAAASHDLRQPLHAMQMYIAALRQKISDKQSLGIVDDIDAVSVSTARLLGALLDVSQLEAGAIEPSFATFPVDDVLYRVYREFSPVAKQNKLDFKMIPNSLMVRSDPLLLERILGNFMSNAVRYTQNGRILLGVRRRGDSVAIEVWDTGRGIPEDQRMAIFEDFYQIDNEERDRSKGLGLGLAIAKRLSFCLQHKIECDSIQNRGSRFAVVLDAVSGKVNTLRELEPLEEFGQSLAETRVLLIEDDADVMKATRQLLVSWGCMVFTGRDLQDVIKLLEDGSTLPLDFIIADNRLPGGVDGVEISAHVHAKIGRVVPTVIITGDVQEEHINGISDLGYQVMCKPVQPAKLRALISHLLKSQSKKGFRPRLVS